VKRADAFEPIPKPEPRRKAKAARKRREHTGGQIVRAEVAARSGGLCELGLEGCRVKADCFHHRLRRSHGGPDTAVNLLHLCNDGCHAFVHANPRLSYERGWLLRSTDELIPYTFGGTR
jgi:hypothetical protein